MGIAKGHMSPGTLHGAVVSAAFVAGVSLLSILKAGDWARVPTPDIIILLTSLLLIGTRIPFNKLSWVSVSSHFVGNCQNLTYKICWVVGS